MSESKNRINLDDNNYIYYQQQENMITDINLNSQIVQDYQFDNQQDEDKSFQLDLSNTQKTGFKN